MIDYKKEVTMNPSGFVVLADFVPHIVQDIRYYSTYNFIGDRIDGYEEPCALLTVEAARALKEVSNEFYVQGYRLKISVLTLERQIAQSAHMMARAFVSGKAQNRTMSLLLLSMLISVETMLMYGKEASNRKQ